MLILVLCAILCSLVMSSYPYDFSILTYQVVLGDINILLPVYGITNSKWYSVFHSILINIL